MTFVAVGRSKRNDDFAVAIGRFGSFFAVPIVTIAALPSCASAWMHSRIPDQQIIAGGRGILKQIARRLSRLIVTDTPASLSLHFHHSLGNRKNNNNYYYYYEYNYHHHYSSYE
jgi:hypothetical protein